MKIYPIYCKKTPQNLEISFFFYKIGAVIICTKNSVYASVGYYFCPKSCTCQNFVVLLHVLFFAALFL